MPKVSVIIPVYNVEQYLERCLDSVINQTLQDIEIICINDGSTDGSLEILQRYAKKDSRIILVNQANKGIGITRNIGLGLARGEYLAFVDSDDWIDLKTFEIIYKKFQETQADIIQFDFNSYYYNGQFQGHQKYSDRLKKYYKCKINNNTIFKLSDVITKDFKHISLVVWDKMFSTKFIKDYNINFSPTKIGEDNIFSIASYIFANKILYVQYPFYNYCSRKGSAVNKLSNDNLQAFDLITILKQFLEEKGLFDKYKQAYSIYQLHTLAFNFVIMPYENRNMYLEKSSKILNKNDYKKLLKSIKNPNLSFWEKIFSIKNQKIEGIKQKVLCVLGIKFNLSKFKRVENTK